MNNETINEPGHTGCSIRGTIAVYTRAHVAPRPAPGQFKTRADYERARDDWKADCPNLNTAEEEAAHVEWMRANARQQTEGGTP